MKSKEIIIFGNGKISETISYYAESECGYKIAAFACDRAFRKNSTFLNRPLVDFEDVETLYSPAKYDMFVAVGYHDLNRLREKKCDEAVTKGYHLVSVISALANLPSNTKVGYNCFAGPPSAVQPFVVLGNNTFIWPGAIVGHHTKIGHNVWLTASANIGGNAIIGDNCFIGLNATIGHCISVGSHCFLGANVLVTKDMEEMQVVITESQNPIRLNSDQFLKVSKFS